MARIVVMVVLVAVGLLLGVAGVLLRRLDGRLDRTGVRVAGRVVDVVAEQGRIGSGPGARTVTYHHVVVAYPVDGRVVRMRDSMSHDRPPYAVGQVVAVTYLPGQPESFRVGDDRSASGAGLLWLAVGGAAVVAGVVVGATG